MADPNKIVDLKISDVTEGLNTLHGTGTFDVFMQASMRHLQKEYTEGRITGDSYAQAYVQIVNNVLQVASQFASGMLEINNNNVALVSKVELGNQQLLTERAQVESELDGNPVSGVIGKEQEVRQSQIDGMRKKSIQEAASSIMNTWTVRESTSTHSTGATSYNLLHDTNIGNAITTLFTENGIKVNVDPPPPPTKKGTKKP